MKYSMMQLQEKLSEQIALLSDETTPFQAKKSLAEISIVISSLAKQMINNADVLLRTEKLASDGKLNEMARCRILGLEQEVDGLNLTVEDGESI